MRGYPQFSFWISITLVKIYICCIIINRGKNTFEQVGTVFNVTRLFILLVIMLEQHFVFAGPVSRKSRNFTGQFWVSQFPLYLKNGEDLSRKTSQLFSYLENTLKGRLSKTSGWQFYKWLFGTFEKRAPGDI